MLDASASPIDHFPAFLTRVPSHIDLEALARQAKAFQRARGVRSGIDLMRLALAWLQAPPRANEIHEIMVWARSGKRQTPTKIRLIARRKPPEVIEAEHKRLHQTASRKQHKPDPRSLIAAEYVILATSLPEEEFPATEVLAVYRLRGQIELAFKRLKSLSHIDKRRTRTGAGTRCWLYAHLIVARFGDDLSQDFLESFPSGAF